jgi:ribonucleoside-diphosphate reductase alpha chain
MGATAERPSPLQPLRAPVGRGTNRRRRGLIHRRKRTTCLDPSKKDLAKFVWLTRYRDPGALPPENDIGNTWRRVAQSVAAIEHDPAVWCEQFLEILRCFHFLPGGRILAGAGTTRQVTLLNCFVMGLIEDSIAGIFEALKESALTMQQGGGVGYDFSTLRPHGSRARNSGMTASGPVSFIVYVDFKL